MLIQCRTRFRTGPRGLGSPRGLRGSTPLETVLAGPLIIPASPASPKMPIPGQFRANSGPSPPRHFDKRETEMNSAYVIVPTAQI
jgi:hypothetical protein